MRVLVVGAGGMLAQDLIPCFSERGYEVLALHHDGLDITNTEAVRVAVETSEAELVINCAAYTKVDVAEKEEYRAFMVNGFGVYNLCFACLECDVPLIHFSTDYVFDGTKLGPYSINDTPRPLNAYGRSKRLGEKHVLRLLDRFYLIRTSWLFGRYGKNFIETMLELSRSQKMVPVINDQRGCPTWTCHLAEAVAALVETGRYGVYHITNSEPTTWFDFAGEIFRLSGVEMELVPVTSEQFPKPAKRPKNSVLDPFPLPQVLEREMPSWREALQEYLRQRELNSVA